MLSRCIVVLACSAPLAAEPDKSVYSLFNPTPRELMREMSTDRPDVTESPRSVDAGHVQLEMSLVEFAREDDGPRADSIAAPRLNLKVGLTNRTDIQFVLDPFIRERTQGEEAISGTSDLTLRLKVNILGNDEGDTAIGVMPFITLPTGDGELSSGEIEGGIIVPFALDISDFLGLGLMAELDFIRNDENGYDTDFVHTATLSRDLFGDVSGFIEYIGAAAIDGDAGYRASFNTGLAWAVTPDIQLDCGVTLGLNGAAEDYGVFAGLSFRF